MMPHLSTLDLSTRSTRQTHRTPIACWQRCKWKERDLRRCDYGPSVTFLGQAQRVTKN